MRELPQKSYSHEGIEERLYKKWEQNGYFGAKPGTGKTPFTIVMPPPNITGQLHMGHALDNTLQDALIRFKRMNGFEALWVPGTDHASIATEVKIVEQMAKEGLTKADVGRDEFMTRAWKWREEFGGRIVKQLRHMGSSCDWTRERFTMDEGCSRATIDVFIKLYEKGLIYRGDRIINWCTECKTSLSDIEVEHEDQNSHLWYVRYDAEDGSGSITVATTRPETMLGDTGVAVNPEDERYKHMIGKNVILPVVGRAIPVVADEYVDMTFGTGAVKMTPAHDPNDFEVAQRTGLPMLRVFTDDGHINENGGKFCGMDRFECRKAIVKDLEKSGALIKIEPYAHAVGTCYRCHTTVEPLVSKQWFVDMKPLAKAAIAAVRDGRIRFVPERFERTYFSWMENIRDWCISRQLWWGHRIPAYYCDNCGEIVVAKEMPKVCPKCGHKHFHQDEDVLDTWFSSGMWPFSTLGYPDQTPDLDYFYPTSTLVTGYDIIFFWVARMIVFGLEVMDEIPFDTVYVHGIVRDSQGRKMSKSLGNGIDPLEVIEKHGADALRFSLIAGNSPGNDMRFYWEKVEAAGNFCNKIYNASRFVLMNLDDDITGEIDPGSLDMADKWLLTRLNAVIGEVTAAMDEYELGIAVQKLYDFVWSEFCDWYIELTKTSLYGEDKAKRRAVQQVLMAALTDILKLLHPFMPFITEELYSYLHPGAETIMLEAWPKARALDYPAEADAMQAIMDAIRAVRNVRAEMNVPPSKRTHMTLVAKPADVDALESTQVYLTRLAGASDVRVQTDKANIPSDAVSVISHIAEIFIPLGDLVDVGAELERKAKEKEHLLSEIARAEGKLNNAGFVAKAPESVVAAEREKLEKTKELLAKLEARLSALKK